MPRSKKDNVPMCIRFSADIHSRLEDFCKKTGQTKTTAVERAVALYLEKYEELANKMAE